MTAPLHVAITVVLAVVVMGGAVTALSAREQRVAILGLLVVLAGAPFLADPLPDARGIIARIAGAALVAQLLLLATRDRTTRDLPATSGPRLAGWPVAALVAVSAAVVAAGTVSGAVGPASGSAPPVTPFLPAASAGAAVLVLAVAPVVLRPEPFRLTIGLVLALAGILLLAASAAGPASALTDLSVAVVLSVVAGGGGLLHRISSRTMAGPRPR